MAETYHERLSGLDRCFLVFESDAAPMHIAAALLFETGPLARPDGGVEFERIVAYIASRLHRVPRYRQKLGSTPLEGYPIWVDDPHFNLLYHLRHTALPHPGDERQLKRLCGRILSQQLDRGKPLWEMWIVEGLEHGRFAVVLKVHHCMADGLAGIELLEQLLSGSPQSEPEALPPWQPRPAPGSLRLLADAALERVRAPLALAAVAARQALRAPLATLALPALQLAAAWQIVRRAARPARATPLNVPIGPHRRFDWLTMDLDAVRRIRRQLGGAINDVVLAIVAGALHRFFGRRGLPVDRLHYRVFAPVGLRGRDGGSASTAVGNRVSIWLIDLPVAEPDARRRLQRICEQTSSFKRTRQTLQPEALAALATAAGPTLLGLGARAAMQLHPFHLIVTNLRGPREPLYLLGARMIASYPLVPLYANLALGIALFSYEDRLHWGLNGDWDRVPELHELVLDLQAAFAELEALTAGETPAA